MKAIRAPEPGGPEAVRVVELPESAPREVEAIVHVRAAGVNRADLLQVAGKYPPPPGVTDVPGLECAGVEPASGRRVMALLPGGGWAEQVAIDRRLLLEIPARLSFEEAAAIPEVWLTAYLNLFLEGRLRAGETVVIHAAASGVGTAAIQLARRAGARVVATTRSASKLELCRSLGAHVAVDTTVEDLAKAAPEVDLILDVLGGGGSLERHQSILATNGRLVVIATMAGPTGTLDFRTLLHKRQRIVGSTLRARPIDEKAELTQRFAEDVLPALASGELRPIVDRVYAFEDVVPALRRMQANENAGKIVLRWSAPALSPAS
ncbi:MAG TPA: NAD(P)H-quinone oxidoreductase [Planctomycetota bacterium]|nr:NAD(P)H-quinone oxidoreductase [Planctomycetota bacterium]